MNKTEENLLASAGLDHVGVVVRNLDKTIDYYQSLGIGPFEKRTIDALGDRTLFGKPASFTLKIATAPMGPIKLELIEPGEGAVLLKEFLENNGEGINHLGFLVDNLDRHKNKARMKGLEIILTIKLPKGAECAYVDTRHEAGGVIMELLRRAHSA